ncbi:MAG TPA: MarR family transcriptional regulator [Xanthobacteraceae bacterium]|nr:MarR family transcriptional regulator [Xanthobacteraceae bacterium]
MPNNESAHSMDDVYLKPGHLFRRMQQIAVAIFMEECAPLDLTPVQYATLVAIRDYPGVDATRLSALIAFDRSTLGSVMERLETKGLITRRATPEDRRVKHLHLSQKGQRLLEKAIPLVDRAQERMLAPLPAKDQKTIMKLLAQLVDLNNDNSRAPMRPIKPKSAGRAAAKTAPAPKPKKAQPRD